MHSLHNHTTLSDGRAEPDEVVQAAIDGGLEAVGIADHFLTKKTRSVAPAELPRYVAAIEALKSRFEGKIRVLAGLEVDASAVRTELDSLAPEMVSGLDYVLFEHVQDDLWDGIPFWEFLAIVKRLKIPCGLAHNDLGRNFVDVRKDYLIEVLVANRVFIELNTGKRYSKMGKQYYELSETLIREFARSRVLFSLGSEGHRDDAADVGKAVEFARRNEMTANLVTGHLWRPSSATSVAPSGRGSAGATGA
jgi:histidinol phosphatase-like PHP family hydrolase